MGRMQTDINKRIREIRWTTEHSLTADQFKKLITQKVNRAKVVVTRSRITKLELRD